MERSPRRHQQAVILYWKMKAKGHLGLPRPPVDLSLQESCGLPIPAEAPATFLQDVNRADVCHLAEGSRPPQSSFIKP